MYVLLRTSKIKLFVLQKFILLCLLCSVCFSTAFGQNTLNDYLQVALKNSPIFSDNTNQIHALTVDSLLIGARLKPQLNFTSNNYFAPVINGYGYDEVITNRGNYDALLGANYSFIGADNLNNQFQSLRLQKQVLELTTKLNERDLKQTVTAQYIVVYGEQQALFNSEKILEALRNENVLLKKSTEKGIYRQTDYLSFLVNYNQQQLSYNQQKLQTKNDLFLLNYLCGIPDTTTIYLAEPELNGSSRINIEQTSSFKLFILDSLQLQNSIEQLHYQYNPKLSLFGDVGFNSSLLFQAEKNFGASIGLNLSIPIYDGNQQNLQLEKFTLNENIRLNHLNIFKKQLTIKQQQLQHQISEMEKLITTAQEQLYLSKTLLKANNQLLETGDVRIADYILSLTNFISSQATTQQLISNRMQLINQLNYLNY